MKDVIYLLFVLSLISFVTCRVDDKKSDREAILEKAILQLTEQLGAEKQEDREKAQKELIEIGESALPYLEKANKHKNTKIMEGANVCIEEIELNIRIKNLPSDRWYKIESEAIMAKGYLYTKTAEGKYEEEDAFVLEDIIELEIAEISEVHIKQKTYCKRDRYLSLRFYKIETSGVLEDLCEMKFKNGKIKVGSLCTIPRLVTTLPFKKDVIFKLDDVIAIWGVKLGRKIKFTGEDKIKLGKKLIKTYKFECYEEDIESSYFWVSEDRQLARALINNKIWLTLSDEKSAKENIKKEY